MNTARPTPPRRNDVGKMSADQGRFRAGGRKRTKKEEKKDKVPPKKVQEVERKEKRGEWKMVVSHVFVEFL